MSYRLIIAASLVTLAAPALGAGPGLTPAEHAAGWTVLFDGTSTDQLRGYRRDNFPTDGWTVEGDTLKVSGGGGDVISKAQYADFELALEFKVAKGANSGIMYRVTEDLDYSWRTGPEYQILDDHAHGQEPTGKHSVGALYDLASPPEDKPVLKAGEFNTARIIVADGRVVHFLNGKKLIDVAIEGDDWAQRIAGSKFKSFEGFGVQPKGHICLQDHGDDVWFRNIKIRDLSKPMPGQIDLFNGRDTTGWTTYFRDGAESPGTFSVRDGVLVCTGKPAGYIQTTDEYTNFVLKLEWRFPEGGGGNSGVLVRKVGNERVWPKSVEAQLHSGHAGDFWRIGGYPMDTDPQRTNGNNTKKSHHAERPIGQWNEYEIVVDGNTVDLWVNGEHLNNAWEVFEQPGTICLQSEGVEIQFRNIRLAPIQ